MIARAFDETDIVLVAACQRGERAALDRLLRRHHDRLYAICRRVTAHDADAADATQNALIAIAKGIGRFDGLSSFTTWAYRVATNAALDEVRRRGRRPDPRDFTDERSHDSRDRTSTTGSSIESVADRVDIDSALRTIPADFRAAVVLRDLCGLDYDEIANVLHIPPGTVRSRIARGRAALLPALRATVAEDAPTSGNQTHLSPRLSQHDV